MWKSNELNIDCSYCQFGPDKSVVVCQISTFSSVSVTADLIQLYKHIIRDQRQTAMSE